MSRNSRGRAICPDQLRQIITDTVSTLVSQHAGLAGELADRTGQDAAIELAGALPDLTKLPHRRAEARLPAIAGQPVVIIRSDAATAHGSSRPATRHRPPTQIS